MRMKGEYEFWSNGKLIYKFHNILTQAVYDHVLKSLNGESISGLNVSHFAFGVGTSTPAMTDTTLEDERTRKAFTSRSKSDNQFVTICQLGTGDANFSISELGVFAEGTSVADSGILLSRALKSIEKNSNIVYNIVYRLTLEQ